MVAEIGIMVGLYIITRCFSFVNRPEPASVKSMSVLTMIVSILFVCAMVIQGFISSAPIR